MIWRNFRLLLWFSWSSNISCFLLMRCFCWRCFCLSFIRSAVAVPLQSMMPFWHISSVWKFFSFQTAQVVYSKRTPHPQPPEPHVYYKHCGLHNVHAERLSQNEFASEKWVWAEFQPADWWFFSPLFGSERSGFSGGFCWESAKTATLSWTECLSFSRDSCWADDASVIMLWREQKGEWQTHE